MLPQLAPFLPAPADVRRYVEVHIGGGAMFFGRYAAVRPALLADANHELVNLYVVVRDNVDALVACMRPLAEAFLKAVATKPTYDRLYYALRERYNELRDALLVARANPVELAALTVVLNKTGFNGLYRLNEGGRYNVPSGWSTTKTGPRIPTVLDELNLRACSAALAGVVIREQKDLVTVNEAEEGDFLYLDPPYVPVSDTANFVGYTAGGYTWRDQEALARDLRIAVGRGVRWALSNSDTPEGRALFEGFPIHTVQARRAINNKGTGRGPVSEIVVLSH